MFVTTEGEADLATWLPQDRSPQVQNLSIAGCASSTLAPDCICACAAPMVPPLPAACVNCTLPARSLCASVLPMFRNLNLQISLAFSPHSRSGSWHIEMVTYVLACARRSRRRRLRSLTWMRCAAAARERPYAYHEWRPRARRGRPRRRRRSPSTSRPSRARARPTRS